MPVEISPAANDIDYAACAAIMAGTDPWIRLGRSPERCLAAVSDRSRELYVAREGNEVLGFILLNMLGPFPGYIQSIAVAAPARGRGLGAELVAYAERRIHRESPNVFLCVSSFNEGARRLYERLGYQFVGTLKDFLIPGADELLFRKTLGPWAEFTPR